MSRGGRGGGRGGGASGRGGGMFSTGSSFMGGLSYNEIVNPGKEEAEKLYPRTPIPDFADPTKREIQSQKLMKDYLRRLRFSAYHVAIPEKKNESQSKFSDRYEDAAESLPSLVDIKDRLNPEFFPKQTWANYFDKSARIAKRQRVKRNAKAVLGGKDDEDGEEGNPEKEEQEARSDEEEAEADEFDDEEENPDYDNNYFDDGADEAEDDEGGAAGEGTYD